MQPRTLTCVILLLVTVSAPGQWTLLPRGSVWKYDASWQEEPGWNQIGFSDSAWPSGPAKLGYGQGNERTLIVADPGDAPPTIYFRYAFTPTNLSAIFSQTLRVLADDGIVVYLNGIEVARRNMPSGPISFTTPALKNIEPNEENFAQYHVRGSSLRTGINLLAAEMHQHPSGWADASFDLELVANIPAARPLIEITAPPDGAVFPTGPISLQATASDAAGAVTHVDFYTNGLLLARAEVEPFSLLWQNPPPGRYTITARAHDDLTAAAESPAIHLQVGETAPPRLVRGPYLQTGSATSMILRWRTDWFCASLIRYGFSADALEHVLTDPAPATEHEMRIANLQPDTVYFYSVGSGDEISSGESFHFRTAATNARPVRIWVIGDSGTADQNAVAVRDAYYGVTGTNYTDVWLMLGDNTYGDSYDADYQKPVFDMYQDLLRQTVLWPTLGNHDAADDPGVFGTCGKGYLKVFSLPANGEAGGLPSGTEQYYSFDHANIHFVCLDSYLSDRSTNGAMLTWLKNDLAATEKDWIIAFWHHPPYSWGTHNSDSDPFQTEMRERVLPVLEAYGADLVLSGHSHDYERSFLMDGHYGYSWQLQPSMILDVSSGGFDDEGPYHKPAGGLGAHQGTVYAVCGCSGAGGVLDFPRHPAMAVNQGGFGSLIIEVAGLQLNASFLRPTRQIHDTFAIDKSAPATIRPHLQIARHAQETFISWPTSNPRFDLEWTDPATHPHWQAIPGPFSTKARLNELILGPNTPNRLFRLSAGVTNAQRGL